jgi:hypothetical protein
VEEIKESLTGGKRNRRIKLKKKELGFNDWFKGIFENIEMHIIIHFSKF